MENEHSHHDWQLNEVEHPTLDQLFNDAWWWARDKGVSPAGNIAMKAHDFPEIPKTYKTMNPVLPKPNQEPEWMAKLRKELSTRFVGLFIYYRTEQCWVRLEEVEIDYRNSPEGRGMDRVKDYYGNMWFVSDLIEAEKNQQVKAYNQCPSDKLVY